MIIQNIGLTGLIIKTKKATVFIDPLSKDTKVGYQPRKADVVCVSRPKSPYYDSKRVKDAYIIDTPGELEVKGVMIFGIPVIDEKEIKIAFHIYTEDISILHLGALEKKPKGDLFGDIHRVDVLAIPVGGMFALNARKAKDFVSSLEPAFVIPQNYSVEGLVPELRNGLASVEDFLKESEAKNTEEEKNLKISKNQVKSDEDRKPEVVLLKPTGFSK